MFTSIGAGITISKLGINRWLVSCRQILLGGPQALIESLHVANSGPVSFRGLKLTLRKRKNWRAPRDQARIPEVTCLVLKLFPFLICDCVK